MYFHELTGLGAIETGALPINTASDFIAQYTGRQEYRFTDPALVEDLGDNYHRNATHASQSTGTATPLLDTNRATNDTVNRQSNIRIQGALENIEKRISDGENIDIDNVREILRLAAALLCRLRNGDDRSIVRPFVKIPFSIFTKRAIKLGLLLWMSVSQENPSLDPEIVSEIVKNWKTTVETRKGIFDSDYLKYV